MAATDALKAEIENSQKALIEEEFEWLRTLKGQGKAPHGLVEPAAKAEEPEPPSTAGSPRQSEQDNRPPPIPLPKTPPLTLTPTQVKQEEELVWGGDDNGASAFHTFRVRSLDVPVLQALPSVAFANPNGLDLIERDHVKDHECPICRDSSSIPREGCTGNVDDRNRIPRPYVS